MSNRYFPVFPFTVALLLIAGCSSESQILKCPAASIPVDTATLPVFQNNPSGLLYTAYVVKAKRDCDIHKYDKQVDASVDIAFRATRAVAGPATTYTAPYYVAIATEGRILAKRLFSVQFTFEQGQTVAEFSDSVSSLSLTVGQDKKPSEYGIIVGFQLTKSQLEYNRRAGRYPQ